MGVTPFVLLVPRTPGDGDFLVPFCRGGEVDEIFDGAPFADPDVVPLDGEEPALGPVAGDGDFDFFALTAWPVITKSLLLTDLRPLYPKTGVFLATVVGAWYGRPSGILVQLETRELLRKGNVRQRGMLRELASSSGRPELPPPAPHRLRTMRESTAWLGPAA